MPTAAHRLFRRPRAMAVLLAAACCIALGTGGADAAVDIKVAPGSDPGQIAVEISGSFERGDAQRVQTYLAGLPKGPQITVSFHSTGGIIDEALRIGRHLHANRIRTAVVGKDRICLSACALAFLGGRDASGTSFRLKGSEALLGFHGFRRIVPDREFTVADMKEAVASTQHALLAIADYLTAVEADIEFMSMMLEKASTDMNYLGNAKAPSIGVHVLEEPTGRLLAPSASR